MTRAVLKVKKMRYCEDTKDPKPKVKNFTVFIFNEGFPKALIHTMKPTVKRYWYNHLADRMNDRNSPGITITLHWPVLTV